MIMGHKTTRWLAGLMIDNVCVENLNLYAPEIVGTENGRSGKGVRTTSAGCDTRQVTSRPSSDDKRWPDREPREASRH